MFSKAVQELIGQYTVLEEFYMFQNVTKVNLIYFIFFVFFKIILSPLHFIVILGSTY